MSTPHIQAQKGQIAPVVLMPGDPLRAKYIAEKYLDNLVCINSVRNMFGYTGTWKGTPITVMASGMGNPSMGIYSWELFKEYDVQAILRIGSAGGYTKDLHCQDVLLATDCFSESTFGQVQNEDPKNIQTPHQGFNQLIEQTARKENMILKKERLHCSDCFYHNSDQRMNEAIKKGCKAVEMESFALFHNAKTLNKSAACLVTISDSFVYPQENLSAEEREKTFDKMILLGLESCAAWLNHH